MKLKLLKTLANPYGMAYYTLLVIAVLVVLKWATRFLSTVNGDMKDAILIALLAGMGGAGYAIWRRNN